MTRPSQRPGSPGARTLLGVRPIDCHAHGLCAELLPELIGLDEWGYPVITDPDLPPALLKAARRAAAACPTLALKLTRTGPLG